MIVNCFAWGDVMRERCLLQCCTRWGWASPRTEDSIRPKGFDGLTSEDFWSVCLHLLPPFDWPKGLLRAVAKLQTPPQSPERLVRRCKTMLIPTIPLPILYIHLFSSMFLLIHTLERIHILHTQTYHPLGTILSQAHSHKEYPPILSAALSAELPSHIFP